MSEICKQGRPTEYIGKEDRADALYHLDGKPHEDYLGSPCRGPQCGDPTPEETIAWIEKNEPEIGFRFYPRGETQAQCRIETLEGQFFAPTFLAAIHLAMRGSG